MDAQRLRFCEAAVECFRRKGVAATNLTDICEETGLSMGALYKFFDSRESLMEGVLQMGLSKRNNVLRGKTWAKLRSALVQSAEQLSGDPFWRELQGVVDWSERLAALRLKEGRVILQQLKEQIEQFTAAGEIAPRFDARRTAQLIGLIVDGALTSARTTSDLHVARNELGAYLDFVVGRVAAGSK